MEAEESLYHINTWGEGEGAFISSKEDARNKMTVGEDMVRSVVRLGHVYELIFEAGKQEGRKEVVEWLEKKYKPVTYMANERQISFQMSESEWLKQKKGGK